MTDQAPELLTCPFCGGKAMAAGDNGKWYVFCHGEDCYAAVGEYYDNCAMPDHRYYSIEQAAAAWNTRPPSERPVALVEENNQLRAEIKTLKRKLAAETDRADGFLLAAQALAGGADHR